MADVARLKKVLLALPEPELRYCWLEERVVQSPPAATAHMLNAVLEQNEAADPDAREVLFTIVLWVASTQDEALKSQLRTQAEEARLFSLNRLLRQAPPPSIHTPPPNEQPIPDYGMGRELTLGERRSLARRPDRRRFDALLADPHPMVIRQLLANPKLTESDAIRLATRRPARIEIIRELARSPRWLRRSRVRLAILHNPGSPPEVALPMLGLCNRIELKELVASVDISLVLRATAQELLDRRPPMNAPDEPPMLQ